MDGEQENQLTGTRMRICVVGPQARAFTARLRQFSTQTGYSQAPLIYVKDDRSTQKNSLLGPSDKQFPLPGDVTHYSMYNSEPRQPVKQQQQLPSLENSTYSLEQIMNSGRQDADANHLQELQEQALEAAQDRAGDWPVELSAQECPRLLKRDLKYLFPNMGLEKQKINVLNLTQKSETDMSAWSREMEEEREVLTASFISSGQAICSTLRRCGYWADFVDPSSGRPYLGQYSNHALFETDDVYKNMGFQIEDLGCCKVLKHMQWGTHAFVGTLFTDAPLDSQIVQDIIAKVNEDSC